MTKWTRSWRLIIVTIVAIASIYLLLPSQGVREIREAGQIQNFALADPRPSTTDWPWWRGIDGRNVARSARIPMVWESDPRVSWRVAGSGRGTPCVWGERVFLLTADTLRRSAVLKCCHSLTGNEIWNLELPHDGQVYESASIAASPACDGKFVYVTSNVRRQLRVTAVDFRGRVAWQRAAGPADDSRMDLTSPVLFKSVVIVSVNREHDSYLAALHRQTGEIIWRVKRADGGRAGSPVVSTLCNRSQLLLAGRLAVVSYDPLTGDHLWYVRRKADTTAPAVSFDDDHLYFIDQQSSSDVICVRGDGSGDVTSTKLQWRRANVGTVLSSPVCENGKLFLLGTDGNVICLEAESGKIEYRKRLEGHFTAPPLIAGNQLLCANDEGVVSILQPESGAVFGEIRLGESLVNSPVIAGEALLLRTATGLKCLLPSNDQTHAERPDAVRRRL